MKKTAIGILLTILIILPFAVSAATPTPTPAAGSSSISPVVAPSPLKNSTTTSNTKGSWNPLGDIGMGLVYGTLTLLMYIVIVVLKTFGMLFTYLTEFLFYLKDYSSAKMYGGTLPTLLTNLKTFALILAFGFLFIGFGMNILFRFWKGDDMTKPIVGLIFGAVLISAYPLLWKMLFNTMGAINDLMAHYITIKTPTNDTLTVGDKLINAMLSISGNIANPKGIPAQVAQDLAVQKNLLTAAKLDPISLYNSIQEIMQRNAWIFFINIVLVLIICYFGIIEMIEIFIMKGIQIVNLFLAHFTGYFVCSTVVINETSQTFWDWLKKLLQLLSFGIFWGLIIAIINVFVGIMIKPNATSIEIVLGFVVILAALKLMAKVGGIADGMMISQRLMENIGGSAKRDVMSAAAGTAATVVAAGAGAYALSSGALTQASAAQRTFSDFGGLKGLGSKFASNPGNILNNTKEIMAAHSANVGEIKYAQNLQSDASQGRRSADDSHRHFDNKYDQNAKDNSMKRAQGPQA